MTSERNIDYTPFLRSAYIDPIRTVTVIDDEYPTLETLIDGQLSNYNKNDIDRLRNVITQARKKEFNWLLDVYDGSELSHDSEDIAGKLYHSDLLILDYHLDGEDDGSCDITLNLIEKLANSSHFNLVVVHTKGYEGNINTVFQDIVFKMQKEPNIGAFPERLSNKVDEYLNNWEDAADMDGLEEKLINSISTIQLLQLCKDEKSELLDGSSNSKYLSELKTLYNSKPENVKFSFPLLIKWLCTRKFSKHSDSFGENDYGHFDWKVSGDYNFLKTDNLFLTVVGKQKTSIKEIPDRLLGALSCWNPHPNKLVLAKLRHEVESMGISAAQNIINKKYLQAAWLRKLLEIEDDRALQSATWNVTSKLWEELANETKNNVSKFALKLAHELRKKGSTHEVLQLFVEEHIIENSNQQAYHENCFSCSKSVESYHLNTGHIIQENSNFWLCLSPACDLVPGQKEAGSFLPVTLVRLYDAKSAWISTKARMAETLKVDPSQLDPSLNNIEEQVLSYSKNNNLIFVKLPEKEDISCFSFTVGIDGKANPNAREYWVANAGIFDEESKEVILHYGCTESKQVQIKSINAKVVAELRYEYALNLLARLGFAKSRVGLDFVGAN
ncbi:response regulator receiver domain [Pleionea sp. CnH1-48]|uniref:response regulator receiver domain n=1 Tax=Pleionea sp. CnH1-48 TaxID=2954494 RepID=UPI002096E9E8|nr:response regulator receiver domain [Pleionea sp. CnH1-48]